MFLKLEQLQARDLVDTGSTTDAQDPGLVIRVGAEEHETSRVKHAGTSADFIETFEIEIDNKAYQDGSAQIEVEVINRGYSGKQNIRVGKGKVSIKSQLVTLGLAATISIELTHVGSAGEVKKGRVLMTGTLLETSAFKVLEPVVIQKINDDTKDELLAQTFGDVGELLDDFHCAYTGPKFLHHGRLYITTRHLCFHSKIFGKEMKVRIPYQHVSKISKSVDKIIKINSTLIVDAGNKIHRFHSFWDFELSYRSASGAFDSYRGEPEEPVTPGRSSSIAGPDIVDEQVTASVRLPSGVDLSELMKTEVEKSKHKITVITQQPLPVSVATFAKLFIEEGAPFTYKAYHESVKDSNVVVTAWQSVGSNEMGREIKFFKPVNLPGLASTRGVKLQNYKRFGEVGLLLSSSTRLEDVPAADCFSVDDTLEVQAAGPDAVTVTISFQVTFVKSTMMKAFIESPTNSEMKKWLAAFFEHLKKKAADPKALDAPTASSKVEEAPPAAATASAVEAPAAEPRNPILQMLHDYSPILLAIVFILLLLALVRIGRLSSKVTQLTASMAKVEALLQQIANNK